MASRRHASCRCRRPESEYYTFEAGTPAEIVMVSTIFLSRTAKPPPSQSGLTYRGDVEYSASSPKQASASKAMVTEKPFVFELGRRCRPPEAFDLRQCAKRQFLAGVQETDEEGLDVGNVNPSSSLPSGWKRCASQKSCGCLLGLSSWFTTPGPPAGYGGERRSLGNCGDARDCISI